MEDVKHQYAQYGFTGQWIPDRNPLQIGPENFSQLDNYRYVDGGIEVCEGYTEINETALETYLKARNGIQLRTPYSQATYVLWQVLNSAGSASRIAVNKADIPDADDFEATYVYTPAATAGRWAKFSQGVGYANGSESCIWDGDEMRCAAFFKITDVPSGLTMTGAVDYTEAVNNSLADGNNPTVSKFLIGSTRPLKGFKVDVAVANDTTSTLAVQEFKSTGWTNVTTLLDGTTAGGITMAQDGIVSFDSTVTTSVQALIEETRLYYYYVALSAGSATINQVTLDAPFQEIVDVWDGVYRDCIHAQATRSSSHENWTQEVNTESSAEYPIAAKFGGLTSSDKILLCCQEKACAVRLAFIAGKVNATAATVTIKYWNGAAYATVGTVYDGTAVSGATLAQTGIISWVSPTEALERQRAQFGVAGYWYEFTFSATLTDGTTHDGTSVDTVAFIPAQKTVFPFAFPFEFQGKAMLCDFSAGDEGNRVDFSMKNAPNVWNGGDSSAMGKSLYFGGYERLITASSIYNRFGSSIYEVALFLKQNETYLLNGTGPEDFRIFKISSNYGCPAPHTVSTAEVSYALSEEIQRNICLWLSYKGPILFDGAVIKPLQGIDLYFDTRKDTCINFEAIDKAYAAFDPFWQEWHLLLPVGTGQTTLNTWLVYDLRRQRWYRRVLDNSALCPQAIMTVQDEQGVSYLYGMTDDGVMMRLNYGTSWNSATMVHRVKTAAIIPTQSIWDESLIRKIKLVHEAPTFTTSDDSITINIRYYVDGATNSVTGVIAPMVIDYTGYVGDESLELDSGEYFELDTGEYLTLTTLIDARLYATYKQSTNILGNSFIFEFYQNSNDYDFLNNFGKRPIAWGLQYQPVREDENF